MTTGSAAWYLAKKAYKGIQYVKGMINCEKHVFDYSTSITPTNAGSIFPLLAIGEGDEYNQRVGRSVLMKHIHIKGQLIISGAASATVVRIIVFYDNNDPTTAVAVGDYLLSTGAVTSVSQSYNPANIGRFTTLMDKTYTLSINGPSNVALDMNAACQQHVKFSDNTSSGYGKGQPYAIVISNEGTNGPTCNLVTRTTYYDN